VVATSAPEKPVSEALVPEAVAPFRRSIGNRLRSRGPFDLFVILVVVVIAAVIVYPVGRLIYELFVTAGSPVDAFRQAFALPDIAKTIRNTLVIVLCSAAISVVIAYIFAWANERTNARMGFAAELVPLMPLLIPSIAGTVGWVFLLSPRAGMINVGLRELFGSIGINLDDGPINLFSMHGLIFLYVLHLVPYSYLPIAAALSRLDPALEEASRVSGVGPLRTMVRVTLPAIRPAVVSGALVSLMMGLAMFSVPAIVGTSARIDVLSVRIYSLLTFAFPARTAPAVALSLMTLLLILGGAMIQRRLLRSAAYATIGGRGAGGGRIRLGRPSRIFIRLGMGVFVVLSVLPFLGLAYVSLKPFWTARLDFQRLSFHNYATVLVHREVTKHALINSVKLGLIGAVIGTILSAMIALYVLRRTGTGSKIVDNIVRSPSALSHLVLAVAFLTAFAGAPFHLQGTTVLLLMAYIIMYLPQSYVSAGSAYQQVSKDLGEASAVCGAKAGATFRQITLPLMMPGLAGTAAILFVLMAGEVTASALLASSGSPVIGFIILDLYSDGTFPQIAAIGTVMTLITTTVTALFLYFGKHRTSPAITPN
jgi:iron(III) transport system permease protein